MVCYLSAFRGKADMSLMLAIGFECPAAEKCL
jgi:hypothetical protein